MTKPEDHLARALENLVAAAESFASELSRRDPAAGAEWHREHGFRLALEYAKRTLARHHEIDERNGAPGAVPASPAARGRDHWFEAL